MKENLTTKNIWEFQKGDSIYCNFKPKGGTDHVLLLCEFQSLNHNTVKAKVIESTINPELYTHKINTSFDETNYSKEKEKGWFITVSYLKCALYGKHNDAINNTYHWFTPFGYAVKDIGLEQDEKTFNHPSFGVITLSKPSSSSPVPLFGSSLQHKNTICMTIQRAELNRKYNTDWIHGTSNLIEVEMSAAQFTDLITSFGSGGGTPVTIRDNNGTSYPDPPYLNKVDEFQDEFEKHIRNIGKQMKSSIEDSMKILKEKQSLTKDDRKAIINSFEMLVQEVSSNIPFISQQFNEQMETTVSHAKSEIESFLTHRITSLGLDVAQKNPNLFLPTIGESE
jgi:uncharacterized protein YoxC